MRLHQTEPHCWTLATEDPEAARVTLFGPDPAQACAALETLVRVAASAGPLAQLHAFPQLGTGRSWPEGCVLTTPDLLVPAAAGSDLGCGVRVLSVRGVRAKKAREHRGELARALADAIPHEIGTRPLRADELDQVLRDGAAWAVAHGFGEEADLARLEGGGRVAGAEPRHVSAEARVRAAPQLGTLGGGAHFIEVATVEEPVDPCAAALGLEPGALAVVIHTGSRALGHQVTRDFLARFAGLRAQGRAPDAAPLATAALGTEAGAAYLAAACAAENFALANRQVATQRARDVLQDAFGSLAIEVAFDTCHDHVRRERVEGRSTSSDPLVHRKGAVRVLPPGHAALPADHRALGSPLLLPGGLGHPSLVLAATDGPARLTHGSLPHGVGRELTVDQARARALGRDLARELARRGLAVRIGKRTRLEEEHPEVWRALDGTRTWLEEAGLARALARLVPFVLVRG